MLLLSDILEKLGINFKCINEKEFSTMGLADYNSGKVVCTFIENIKFIDNLSNDIAMVITNTDVVDTLLNKRKDVGVCVVEKPKNTFFTVHNTLAEQDSYCIEKRANKISSTSQISQLSSIANHNVVIGKNVIIEEFCTIRENTTIGDNSIIRAGCQIGGVGFEFKKDGERMIDVEHLGSVVIGKNVEIQQNTCVDRAIYPWDRTFIDNYTRVDNLVHIAHGVKIGKRCMIVANSGIGGRVQIGEDCWIGFGAMIRNGLIIESGANVNMGAVVTRNVESRENVSGNFAISHDKFIQHIKDISSGGV